ncbi:MAG: hypothetical protein PHG83_03570 [Patescibacteria group bacterium]|nr:hypothetical protein [Patescibacteria group bacterium]
MKYFLTILATLIAIPSTWHYYRWCIWNNRINRPRIYWSYKGALVAILLMLVWLGVVLFFFKWYFVFIPIVIIVILGKVAFYQSLNAVKKEYMGDGKSEKEAEELARLEIKNYDR